MLRWVLPVLNALMPTNPMMTLPVCRATHMLAFGAVDASVAIIVPQLHVGGLLLRTANAFVRYPWTSNESALQLRLIQIDIFWLNY